MKIYLKAPGWLLFSFLIISSLCAQDTSQAWLQYKNPEHVGFSTEKLSEAEDYWKTINSAAFMVVFDGKVVVSWGDVERRYMCHSVRKSFLSALMGIYVDQGIIDLDKTVADLGIDDINGLTDEEKTATVRDLLKARSGVYHSAAYETEAMKKIRPERGTHKPGKFWYYNNWDFNTLCGIFTQETRKDFFRDFKEKIADPIGMEDFRLMDTYYHLEAEHSKFPAYPFRMSARDMARFGQLFLQNGRWQENQIVSAEWITESTKAYTKNARRKGTGYSYLWWTGIYGKKPKNYSAQGVGNQAIIVYPKEGIVMINRTDTWKRKSVDTEDLKKLTEMIFAAKTGKSQKGAALGPLESTPSLQYETATFPNAQLVQYLGSYTVENLNQTVQIRMEADNLLLETPFAGRFFLDPISESQMKVRDAGYTLQFRFDESGILTQKVKIIR